VAAARIAGMGETLRAATTVPKIREKIPEKKKSMRVFLNPVMKRSELFSSVFTEWSLSADI